MSTRNIPVDEAGEAVADVMLRGPRTLAPNATVADARAAFENPRERLLLVADGDLFLGAVTPERLGEGLGGDVPLGGLANREAATIGPGAPVTAALEMLDAADADRLPVVEEDGTLVGLVCYNRHRAVFCVS